MSTAIRIIKAEHIGIWRILNALEEILAETSRSGARPNERLLEAILHYIESYTDRVHHPKEDDYLFVALRQRVPQAVPIIEKLEREHEEGPGHVRAMREALAICRQGSGPEGVERLKQVAGDYIRFQREHISLEESKLLPLAREHLTEEDWAPIDEAFQRNDDPLFGEQVREEFRDLRSRIASYAPEPMGLGLQGDYARRPPRVGPPARETSPQTVLKVEGVSSHYGPITALSDLNLEVGSGQIVALVGANGAGKTTLLRTISGLQPASSGRILYRGEDITHLPPARRVSMGIAQVPEGRQLFGPMSVEDNLLLGAYTRSRGNGQLEDLERMYEMFPILREKRRLPAATLSGGQQQMVAIARALMARPRLLLLDEPSMGLAPLLVAEIFDTVVRLKEEGITIFLVEQNAAAALAIADQGYVLETGRVVKSGAGQALRADEDVQRAYLGM